MLFCGEWIVRAFARALFDYSKVHHLENYSYLSVVFLVMIIEMSEEFLDFKIDKLLNPYIHIYIYIPKVSAAYFLFYCNLDNLQKSFRISEHLRKYQLKSNRMLSVAI
jgi:hypothetical protein